MHGLDYELVRIHHPDSPFGRDLSPAIRRSRFQAITAAYDTLRGKTNGSNGPVDVYRAELERRRRARAAYEASRRRAGAQAEVWTASADDRWKDIIILFVGIMVRTPTYPVLLQVKISEGLRRHSERGWVRCWSGHHLRRLVRLTLLLRKTLHRRDGRRASSEKRGGKRSISVFRSTMRSRRRENDRPTAVGLQLRNTLPVDSRAYGLYSRSRF